jgi:hypothetical protein
LPVAGCGATDGTIMASTVTLKRGRHRITDVRS